MLVINAVQMDMHSVIYLLLAVASVVWCVLYLSLSKKGSYNHLVKMIHKK